MLLPYLFQEGFFMTSKRSVSRRQFLGTAAAAGAFTIVPSTVFGGPNGTAPSDKIRLAGIGAGGQAMHDLGQVVREGDPIVALADVDWARAENAFKRWPDAKKYKDYREMLEKEGDNIDAVVIACPDHIHAPAALMAIEMGKHVYVEKPMAHTVEEVRILQEAAKKAGVVTAMGNQGHSFPGVHLMRKWVDMGILGDITKVECWTNRPSWPQGVGVPEGTPPVPDTLDWNLWLGPAEDRPYHPAYCPRDWRGWADFGEGALGDMGCHILDSPYHALQLGAPTRISAETSGYNGHTFPEWSIITYEFPERGPGLPAVTLTWYDGGKTFEAPPEWDRDTPPGDRDGGTIFHAEKAPVVSGTYSNMTKILDDDMNDEYKDVETDRPESMAHHLNWIAAIRAGGKAMSDFDYAAGLTEMVLLGNVAVQAGQPIEWDAAKREITNVPESNQFLSRAYREGWKLT
jgi:predicted dehydrogenase